MAGAQAGKFVGIDVRLKGFRQHDDLIATVASPSGRDAAADPASVQRFAADARAAAFGRIVALLMASPRHASMTLADAQCYLTPAIAHGQLAIMGTQQADGGATALAAAAWWAMVSPEVDQRLTESREPHLTLDAADWRSGDQPWIIETIGDAQVVNELLRRLADKTFTGKLAKLERLPPMAASRLAAWSANLQKEPQTKA